MPKFEDPGTPESRYRYQLKIHPGSIGLLAEGDSWFAFPNLLRTNLFLELQDWSGDTASTWSLARNGDTAHEIMFGQQFEILRRLFSDPTLPMHGFLFSGGGNDFVGENLPNLLNTYRPGMQWLDCVNLPYVDLRFRDIASAYQRLVDLRNAYRPQVYLFTHGYDFANPNDARVHILLFSIGGWLKGQFLTKGIKDKQIQKEIITYLLGRFNSMLVDLEASNQRIIHVRTQGTLKDSDWADELHPTIDGFKKVALKFKQALKTVFPNLPKPQL